MKLEQIKENPDGSADYMITELTEKESMSLIRLGIIKALETAIEDARRYDPNIEESPPCNTHPDAPHGFNRTASHALGRDVCECEGWTPDADSKTEG